MVRDRTIKRLILRVLKKAADRDRRRLTNPRSPLYGQPEELPYKRDYLLLDVKSGLRDRRAAYWLGFDRIAEVLDALPLPDGILE